MVLLEPAEQVHLVVAAACVDRGAMMARIAKRAPVEEAGAEASAARTLHVEIAPHSGQVRGSFWVEMPDGRRSGVRSVQSATCLEVAEQLALVAALTLRVEAPTQAPEAPAAPVGAPLPPKDDWRIAGLQAWVDPESPPPRRPWKWAAGVGARLWGDPASGARPGAGLHLQGTSPEGAWGRIGAQWSSTWDANDPVRWWTGELMACPGHLELGARFAISPCGRVAAGSMSTVNGLGAREWGELGVLGELAWQLGEPWELGFGAGLSLPLARPEFVYRVTESERVAYKPAAYLGFFDLRFSRAF